MLGYANGLAIAMVNTMQIQKNTCLWNSSSGQSSRDLLSGSVPASTFQKNCPKKHISNVPVAARLHAIPIAPSTPGATTKPHSFASPVISNGYVPGRHASVSLALLLPGPDLDALALLRCLPSFRWQAGYWCTRMPDPFLAWCASPKTSRSRPTSTMLLLRLCGDPWMTVLRRALLAATDVFRPIVLKNLSDNNFVRSQPSRPPVIVHRRRYRPGWARRILI